MAGRDKTARPVGSKPREVTLVLADELRLAVTEWVNGEKAMVGANEHLAAETRRQRVHVIASRAGRTGPAAHRLSGSSTVLIHREDPFPGPLGLACRWYRTETGIEGSPSVEQLRTALAR